MSQSQFGEDRFVADRLQLEYGQVVEIGAGDGDHLSNSAMFRDRGWSTVLVEPDERHHDALHALERLRQNVVVHYCAATPENINRLVTPATTFLSIDVDGDDIFLLEALEHRPLAICVEFNPTMPWHVDAHQARPGLQIGASVAALTRVARAKGYGRIHVTTCNAIFELGADEVPLPVQVPDYAVATDYFSGRPFVVGTPPWGVDLANPVPPEDVVVR